MSLPDFCPHCGASTRYMDFYNDDGAGLCESCQGVIRYRCEACHGDGCVEEDEYEGDWVNFGGDLIVCPDCRGDGWIYVKAHAASKGDAE